MALASTTHLHRGSRMARVPTARRRTGTCIDRSTDRPIDGSVDRRRHIAAAGSRMVRPSTTHRRRGSRTAAVAHASPPWLTHRRRGSRIAAVARASPPWLAHGPQSDSVSPLWARA
jgi:hypothetical protein